MDDLPDVQRAAKGGRCHVNRKLLPIKGFYFAFLAAVGSLLPFIAIYMKSLGLTSSEAGVLYGIMPFVGFFVRPAFGAIADRWHKHKIVLMICSVLTGFFYLLILTIPARVQPTLVVHSQLDCNIQDSFFRDCTSSLAAEGVASHTCTVSLSEFADIVTHSQNASSYNDSILDCEAECTQIQDTELAQICFAEGPGDFAKQCNGTVISQKTVTFHIRNLPHVLNSEVKADRIDDKNIHCRNYDLKMVQLNQIPYWQLLCDEEATLTCKISCKNPPPELCHPHEKEYDSTFVLLFVIYLLANLAFSPVFSLADAATFDSLGGQHHKFGEQRLWGTVGFALLAITSTFTMYIMSQQGSQTNYTVPFYIFAVFCGLAAVIAYFMDLSASISCGSLFRNVLALITHLQVLVFLLVVLYFGMATGLIEGFLFWYLNDLGATPLVFGLSLVINCLFEVPLLFISGFFIKRVGAVPCLYVSMAALATRLLSYSFLVNPWVVLAIEPLHGVTFGIMWAAASTNAAMIAPAGMSATIQGLVGGIHFGIGKGLGSLLTGFLFKNLGERSTFRIYAIVAVILLVIYAILNIFVFKSRAGLHHPRVNDDHKGTPEGGELAESNGYPLLNTSNNSPDQSLDSYTPKV